MEFNERQLILMRSADNNYFKLCLLVSFMCINQNKLELKKEILNDVKKIEKIDEKIGYLLWCYFNYSVDKSISLLDYIGIPVNFVLNWETIKSRVDDICTYPFIDEEEVKVDYNLSHLQEKGVNKVKKLNNRLYQNRSRQNFLVKGIRQFL